MSGRSARAELTMVSDHGNSLAMDSMPISKFKATCLAALERVRRTGRPLRVTRFGKPVADVVPPAATATRRAWLGGLQGTLEIRDDLVSSASSSSEWDVLR